MAYARKHLTAADGTFSATGATEWDRAHAVVDAISGGIPYFDSTTSEAVSALLAANSLVIGGGAGAAPFTSANVTYDSTRVIVGAAAVSGGFKAFAGNSVNSFTLFSGTTNQTIRAESNALGIHYALVGDSTGSGGATQFQFGAQGAVMFNSANGLGAGAIDASFSRIAAGVLGVGTGATGSFAGSLQLTGVELGHASDTTLSRSAAGVLAVEGVVIPSISSTNTLTNKWVKKKVTTVASTTTSVTIDYSTTNMHVTTAQAGALLYNNPTGSPGEGDALLIKIQGDGTARALTWDTQFDGGSGTLPTTCAATTYSYFAFIFNSTDTTWDYTGTATGF